MHANFGHQLYSVSSDTLVRLASGLSEQCVKKQCGLAGLSFTSPESVRELQRWDKTVTTNLDITKYETKKGVK